MYFDMGLAGQSPGLVCEEELWELGTEEEKTPRPQLGGSSPSSEPFELLPLAEMEIDQIVDYISFLADSGVSNCVAGKWGNGEKSMIRKSLPRGAYVYRDRILQVFFMLFLSASSFCVYI